MHFFLILQELEISLSEIGHSEIIVQVAIILLWDNKHLMLIHQEVQIFHLETGQCDIIRLEAAILISEEWGITQLEVIMLQMVLAHSIQIQLEVIMLLSDISQ